MIKDRFDSILPFKESLGEFYCYLGNKVPFHISQINSSCTLIYDESKNIFRLNVSQCFVEKIRKKDIGNLKYALAFREKQMKIVNNDVSLEEKFYHRRPVETISKFKLKKNGKVIRKFEIKEYNPENKIISLDPGLRTFMTGLTENKVFEFGKDIYKKIRNKYAKLYRAKIPLENRKKKKKTRRGRNGKKKKEKKHKPLSKKRYKKLQTRTSKRISNMVDGLHHSTCDQIVKNVKETVLLGNMSSKSIISNKTSKLSNQTKRISQRMKFYQFKMRLKSKCEKHKVNFVFVDESYTSITCSSCGELNEELGASKTFKCPSCGIIFDRDVNACRGIYMKSLDEKNHRP